ncbi:Aminopeptidase S [compost metagenome]
MLRFCGFLMVFFLLPDAFGQDSRIREILQHFSPDSLHIELRRLSGEIPVKINGNTVTIQSRLYNNPGNNQAFQYIKQQFTKYGLQTQSQSFSTNGVNLFGIKYGTLFPERVCIIGAHYDNLPTGPTAPGADDNASGCAAVLEAARLLSGVDLPNTVIFAAWDEEELGLIGSNAYVSNGIHGASFLGYINLDMIGWDGNGDRKTEVHTRPIAQSVDLAEKVSQCNEWYDINLLLEIVNPGAINTDHYSFWQGGHTAVGINEEYDGDENPHYHQVTDQFQYLDTAYLNANSRLAIATLATLAFEKSQFGNPSEIAAQAELFPNPAKDLLNVEFRHAIVSPFQIDISDTQGRTIFSIVRSETKQVVIPIDMLSAGMYSLTIRSSEFKSTFPFVKH